MWKFLFFCLLAHAKLLYFSCKYVWGQLWLTSQETLCFENMEIPRQLHASLWNLKTFPWNKVKRTKEARLKRSLVLKMLGSRECGSVTDVVWPPRWNHRRSVAHLENCVWCRVVRAAAPSESMPAIGLPLCLFYFSSFINKAWGPHTHKPSCLSVCLYSVGHFVLQYNHSSPV